MVKLTKGTFTPSLARVESQPIPAYLCDTHAVHKLHKSEFWTVSHRQTGMGCCGPLWFKTKREAVAFLEEIMAFNLNWGFDHVDDMQETLGESGVNALVKLINQRQLARDKFSC